MTKAIILSAGRGYRLNKYTKVLPKGMLEFLGRPLLRWQIEELKKNGISDISVVRGYQAEKINFSGIRYYNNDDWENTGPAASLFCAKKELDGSDDILVSYADIIYDSKIIKQVQAEKFLLSKVVDTDYKEYWTMRLGDWKKDSESCVLTKNGSIVEIGADGVSDENRLHGRDTGITFISKKMAVPVLEHYAKISATHWDAPFANDRPVSKFNMTDLMQTWIENGWKVRANKIQRGWMEFDTASDYENAARWAKTGEIKKIIDFLPEQ